MKRIVLITANVICGLWVLLMVAFGGFKGLVTVLEMLGAGVVLLAGLWAWFGTRRIRRWF